MKKVTIKASSDIALVKYWGKKDEVLRLPENGSISIILDGLDTITTVEFNADLKQDTVTIQGEVIDATSREAKRVFKHLDRIRALAKVTTKATVVSQNTFPRGTGLSSSGSGMAALTFAATKALDLNLTEKELSILSRQASGTACRCACSGFVEWLDGETSETSYSQSIFSADHWDIRDVVAVVHEGKKKISSTEGHTTAQTSAFFAVRQERIPQKIVDVKKALEDKDFTRLGALVEAEALEFHSILLTSAVPLILWYPGTLQVMTEVQALRSEGIECYFTINTGFNLHVLTLPQFQDAVAKRLSDLPLVTKTLTAKVGTGPKEISEHLF
ncbi:MAG: diphosphomevalonate decarboxylase [Candidatus Pacebacteria bacterium]|nr:diphosphomevalonate decarboxylase [Candidatus Paceibacterota bacterium]PIR64168.1 MAG: diphosphomevalonate decarboxylase [Candidatus Pacebacteria bacterium CG10_big_fil_rev_8_21_14_0_10_40_26]PIZ79308.1 MAG: diphosphomevalonate decarboxylase [Candidatus Pacebacteria bacterium CG_4_10_14_0_2_um_filter_40_20]PJA68964.1 MAG: diphosphomevalonate decarboxylase [Candidatus Pacebacteria bacterium CG_4_9_14_3_um_filter_40_12]PJC42275.1 MAG: diphosphomevalonate decarboxylase [Candidatus Pacebacteria 